MASVPDTCDIGLIGLAVMGENLVLNMESKGFSVAVFNRTTAVTEKFAVNRAAGKNIKPTKTMEEFVHSLMRPRKDYGEGGSTGGCGHRPAHSFAGAG